MICLKCESSEFEKKKISTEQEFKGETFNIMTESCVCSQCGFAHFDDEQANILRKRTMDAYENLKRDTPND